MNKRTVSNTSIEMTSQNINSTTNNKKTGSNDNSNTFPLKRIKSGGGRRDSGVTETLILEAAKNGDADELESLLDDGVNPNVTDDKGRTALHYVVSVECSCLSCTRNAETCLKLVLNSPKTDINAQDQNGDTALHLAAKNQIPICAEILLSQGADISIRNKTGEEAVSCVAKHTPDSMIYLLNQSIFVDQYDPNHEKCVLKVDFGPVVGHSETSSGRKITKKRSSYSSDEDDKPSWQREMKLLTSILQANKLSGKKILTHPVVSIFLELKWKRVRKFFWASFFCYMLWVILYSSYILYVYVVSCPCLLYSKNSTSLSTGEAATKMNASIPTKKVSSPLGTGGNARSADERSSCVIATGFNADVLIIVFLTAIMLIIDICKMIITPRIYLKTWMNWANWVLALLVFLTTIPNFREQKSIEAWQYQTAAFAIFLAWAFILSQVARFPSLGRFIEMFGRVLRNFGFFMITYAALFTAFAFALCILFPGNTPFGFFFYAILKVLVMMVGEVDYQEMFYSGEEVGGPVMGHVLYAIFVIVVSVVLMNLLIGLTVSDIQGLQKEAELTRISRLIVELFHLETFIFSTRIAPPIGHLFKRLISVMQPIRNYKHSLTFTFRPNAPEDKTLPERLKLAALQLAIISYKDERSHKCRKSGNGSSNPVLRSYTSSTSESSSLETHSLEGSCSGKRKVGAAAWSQ